MNKQAHWGVIGMGVMGTALARNMGRKGISLALYNRYVAGKEEGVARQQCHQFLELKAALPFEQLDAFVASLQLPRKIICMLPAGAPTQSVLSELMDLLSPGDIVIDGGNAHFETTQKCAFEFESKQLLFIGMGVSGGKKGALEGPSLMLGGSQEAYETVRLDLERIAAKNQNGQPCLDYFGEGGAGHFVKMIHNGIEYGEMQLLAEVYEWMRCQESPSWNLFGKWQKGSSKSYLLGISESLLTYKSKAGLLIDEVEDVSLHKGTGLWSSQSAITLDQPASVLMAALHARFTSAQKDMRVGLAQQEPTEPIQGPILTGDTLKKAYDLARWINHHQGFAILEKAKAAYGWSFSLDKVAHTWTGGCIIQSQLMQECVSIFDQYSSLIASTPFQKSCRENETALMEVLQWGLKVRKPLPAFSAAWQYQMAMHQSDSTGNFIQSLRDYFGAHGLEWKSGSPQRGSHGPWHRQNS